MGCDVHCVGNWTLAKEAIGSRRTRQLDAEARPSATVTQALKLGTKRQPVLAILGALRGLLRVKPGLNVTQNARFDCGQQWTVSRRTNTHGGKPCSELHQQL